MQGTLRIVAPPLGAILLGVLPLHGIMGIDVVTAMLAIVPLIFVRIPRPRRSVAAAPSGRVASVLSDVREGWRYIWSWPGMAMLGAMARCLTFCSILRFRSRRSW